ncbi:hypothetical protein [Neisseria polysaccharea]|uniref:hypothetical protein n=1 Tax=Neisseria polysaccharea TaxID=489 RepID=UPI0001D9DB5B|nr:hypothetical protein [Neisseria polysaccharea]EFH23730.1 hypothetical protein NEIPOLOT_00475 [Neisseria polysaccharea ATCC 43768]
MPSETEPPTKVGHHPLCLQQLQTACIFYQVLYPIRCRMQDSQNSVLLGLDTDNCSAD